MGVDTRGARSAWLFPAIIASGALAIAAGGVGWIYEGKADEKRTVVRAECPARACIAGSAGAAALEEGRRFEDRRNLSFLIGGVLGALSVTGVVWYLVDAEPDADATQTAAVCGPHGCRLQLTGQF
jgi:hypothetical protein